LGPEFSAGGKSGLRRAGWSLTATGGDPKESATENIPPRACGVRVKRRGKSSPLFRRRKRHGKPHPEQDQIGERLRAARPMFPGRVARGSGQPLSQRNDHRLERGNPLQAQNPAYDLLGPVFYGFRLSEKRPGFFCPRRKLNAFSPFGSFLVESPHAKADRDEK